MASRVVAVMRPMVVHDDDRWLVYDESGEHEDRIEPDAWLREAMGGRMKAYFVASPSAEGWIFKRRDKRAHHW